MTRLAVAYLMYLLLSVGITVSVGHTLHKHGRLFLIDVFHGHVKLADSVNHLLLVGFYLLNVALVLFLMRANARLPDAVSILTFLTDKLAVVFITLGLMHFFNVGVLTAVRRRVWARPTKLTTFVD